MLCVIHHVLYIVFIMSCSSPYFEPIVSFSFQASGTTEIIADEDDLLETTYNDVIDVSPIQPYRIDIQDAQGKIWQ